MLEKSQVFVSWSGGKDCCLACYRAMKSGLDVRYLASIITKRTGRLWPHLLSPETLEMQAKAMGIPLVQWWTNVADYNAEYKKMLLGFKEEGITGGVFGDVNVGNGQGSEHKQWIESVCRPVGITPHLPLWDEGRESLLKELIDAGFEIIIIAADDKLLGKSWLGQKMDTGMLSEFKVRHQLSPTGEVGYYHTLVVDGPIFKKRLQILKTADVYAPRAIRAGLKHDGVWYLDILECGLGIKDSAAPATGAESNTEVSKSTDQVGCFDCIQ